MRSAPSRSACRSARRCWPGAWRRAAGSCWTSAASLVGLATTATGGLETGPAGALRFTGTLHGVPWGRHLRHVLVVVEHADDLRLVELAVASATCRSAHNPAGEPRDRLLFEQVAARSVACPAGVAQALVYDGALWRVGQMAGAMQAVLRRTVEHARDRVQFGKSIAAFQAVQQQIAQCGAEAAAAACAAQVAFRSAARADRRGDASGDARFEIAAAKLRANLAVETVTAVAHQVHGAIGFTHEHDLHHYTRRLLAWRSEFGSDRHWSETLGQAVISRGVDTFWSDLTARDDAAALAASTMERAPERRRRASSRPRAPRSAGRFAAR